MGGMERLNHHILLELERSHEVHLIGPTDADEYVPCAERVTTCVPKPITRFLWQAIPAAIRIARHINPQFILAGSGVNALPAWLSARVCDAPLIIYLHGLDIVIDNFWYRHFFLPIIRRADAWLVNSRATAKLAVEAGLNAEHIHILHPGVELPDPFPSMQAIKDWRSLRNFDNRPIMLSVGRLTRRKGLAEFVRLALREVLEAQPDALLVVIGEEPLSALAATGSLPDLLAAIEETGCKDHVRFLGKLKDEELSLAYAGADVLVFPVLDIPGDMEGFGMVAIEASAHGTPTVAFAVGGVLDAVGDGQSGRLIRSGDYSAFAEGVLDCLGDTAREESRDKARQFAMQFAWPRFGEKLRAEMAAILRQTEFKQ